MAMNVEVWLLGDAGIGGSSPPVGITFFLFIVFNFNFNFNLFCLSFLTPPSPVIFSQTPKLFAYFFLLYAVPVEMTFYPFSYIHSFIFFLVLFLCSHPLPPPPFFFFFFFLLKKKEKNKEGKHKHLREPYRTRTHSFPQLPPKPSLTTAKTKKKASTVDDASLGSISLNEIHWGFTESPWTFAVLGRSAKTIYPQLDILYAVGRSPSSLRSQYGSTHTEKLLTSIIETYCTMDKAGRLSILS